MMSFIAQHWQRDMVDAQAVNQIFSWEVFLAIIAAINGVLAWRIWPAIPAIMGRINDRRRDHQNASDRLQDRLEGRVDKLEKRCDKLEEELAECHRERDEWMSRAVAAEATMIGKGRADQEAQIIVSTERQADAAARKGKA